MNRRWSGLAKLAVLSFLSSVIVSCAFQSSGRAKIPSSSQEQSDAATDAALGALEEADETEAQKEAKEIEVHGETNQTLRELEERRRREEEERLQRSITSDSLLEQQVKRES